jgi:hypothetical protein
MKIDDKKYVDNQIDWLKSYVDAELRSVRQAVDKVEVTNMAAVNKVDATNVQKFEAQNEWRGQLKDQVSTFLSRKEFWAVIILVVVGLILNYLKK